MPDLANLPTFLPLPATYLHSDLNAAFANLTIAPNAVTFAKFQALSAKKLLGNSTAGAANMAEIGVTDDVWGLIGCADKAALRTFLDVRQNNVAATDRLLGRVTAGAGVVEEIPCTPYARTLLDDANAAAACVTLGLPAFGLMARNTLAYLETTAVNVTKTGSGNGVAVVFNAVGAPTLQLTEGKWLVIGTVSLRMNNVSGPCGLRFSDNAGANHFGAGSAPELGLTRGQATVMGYKHVTAGLTFDLFFHGVPAAPCTLDFGEATGIAYAGAITAVKLEGP